jgi:hypothetical protein
VINPILPALGPLAIRVAEKRLVARLRAAKATVEARAIRLDDLGWVQRRRLQRLAKANAARETTDGRWYLDEPDYAELVAWRRRMALVAIVAAVLAGLTVYLLPIS